MRADPTPPRPARLVGRALRRRCPACGTGGIFYRWFRMKPRCPGCGHVFAREDGFGLGAILVNLAITETVLAFGAIVPAIALLASDPDASLWPLALGGLAVATIGPVVFFPFSRTLWVAFELMLRPSSVSEPHDRS